MTTISAGILVTGIAILSKTSKENDQAEEGNISAGGATLMIFGALVMSPIGISMMVKGGRKKHEYQQKLNSLTFQIYPDSGKLLSVSYHF